ncbi:Minor extracellular protease vpr [Fulvia fulva]|nr:Minor extracellular protease vpr [Fulvia fulva]
MACTTPLRAAIPLLCETCRKYAIMSYCFVVFACYFLVLVHSTKLIVEVYSLNDVSKAASYLQQRQIPCLDSSMEVAVHRRYTNTIFPGLAIDVSSGHHQTVDTLKECISALPQVVNVWQSHTYKLSSSRHAPRSTSPQKLNPGIFHELTGVDKLHEQGIKGQGVVIGIIDEGVDYLHPAFGRGLGENFTVQYGLDLAGDAYAAGIDPVPDPDPYAECSFHGTHVTGIATGAQEDIGYVGVAPEAKVEHYRITGCDDSAPLRADVIVDAILAAHRREVDVMSISLDQRTGPFDDDVVSAVLERIAKEDKIVVVVSAGNEGWQGPFSATSPASAKGVISVGAVNAKQVVYSTPRARYRVLGGKQWHDFAWSTATPSRFPASLELHALTLNTNVEDDACNELKGDLDLSGRLVLVRRGTCNFDKKMMHLAARGAEYVLLYDNEADETLPFRYDNNFPGIKGAGSVTAKTGKQLISLRAAGSHIEMAMDSNFTLEPYLELDEADDTAGYVSSHGSWGPSGDLSLEPSLVAPGWDIWSTVPRSWGGYDTFSGTSMAAPYAAGCIALLRQVFPDVGAEVLARRLSSTAKPMRFNDGTNKTYDFLAPAWQQGGGLVNLPAATNVQTDVSLASLSFNDTHCLPGILTFELTNCGDGPASYSLRPQSAVTLAIFANSSHKTITSWTNKNTSSIADQEFLDSLLPQGQYADILLSPTNLILAAGETSVIEVAATLDKLKDLEARCPLYSGFVEVTSNRSETLTIPYGGIACRMADIASLPPGSKDTFLSAATFQQVEEGGNYGPQAIDANRTFTLPHPTAPVPELNSTMEYPTVILKLGMYSPAVQTGLVGMGCTPATCPIASYPERENTGRAGGYSRVTTSHLLWRGQLANGTWAHEGCCAFEVCAARMWHAGQDCLTTSSFCFYYAESG